MGKIDASTYRAIVHIRPALRFDIALFVMRLYGYMTTIGTLTMLTLSGYSSFIAGTVASVLAVMTFLIAPRVSKLIDKKGQSKVIPVASAITAVGLIFMIASVTLDLPLPCCYVATVLMGFYPNAPAIARSRWTYLVRTNKFAAGKLDLRQVFAYEGFVENVGFAAGPAINIALAAAIHPVAGMVSGLVFLVAGTAILMTAKATEPDPNWKPVVDEEGKKQEDDRAIFTNPDSPWVTKSNRSVFVLSPTVRSLFFCFMLMGAMFGSFDNTVVSYAQSVGEAGMASITMALSGIFTALASFAYGLLKVKSNLLRTFLTSTIVMGVGFALFFFVGSVPAMIVVTIISSALYPPFPITANTLCEHVVPGHRVTEGITWINSGTTCGFAIGPTLCGLVIDTWGASSGFLMIGIIAVLIPILGFAASPAIKKALRD